MAVERELQVVVRERNGVFRKAGTVFLTMAVIVASVTILVLMFAGDAPEELFAASLVLAGIGIGLALVDWALRLVRRGIRTSWQNLRQRRAVRHDPAAIRARIDELEREIEVLRARLAQGGQDAQTGQEAFA